MDPNNPALNGADPAADPANGNPNPDPNADPANGGVTPPAADPNNPAAPAAKKDPDPVPYGRFKEMTEDRNALRSQVDSLTGQVTYLTEMVQKHRSGADTTPKEQVKAQSALDDLIAAGEIERKEATKMQNIIDAMGYKRGDAVDPNAAKVTELEKKVDFLTNSLSSKADSEQKAAALKSFEGVVDEAALDDELKSMARSKDPELRELAKSASYTTIIKLRFHDKIVQAEVDAALKAKTTPAPKIDPAKSTPARTPASKEIRYDPKDPKAYDRAVKAEMRAKLRANP